MHVIKGAIISKPFVKAYLVNKGGERILKCKADILKNKIPLQNEYVGIYLVSPSRELLKFKTIVGHRF